MVKRSKPYQNCEAVWNKLLQDIDMEKKPYEVKLNYRQIEGVIGAVVGIDERTIKKYMQWLIRFGFIEQKGKYEYRLKEKEDWYL